MQILCFLLGFLQLNPGNGTWSIYIRSELLKILLHTVMKYFAPGWCEEAASGKGMPVAGGTKKEYNFNIYTVTFLQQAKKQIIGILFPKL